ncbi:gas1-like protein [Grosmannia clavigera kw1407]|uniref:Gas1-like protein n=1 Tax=Grosmannia clavigera (strain kw1407 / UAMH 11150) TaxID=655863 RepID=F0XNJ8_GROCL|nr:gas1-like protein [Grosmannia clavigera kw1407]EFX00317.1 gas1-like protein [Grosmannia clavigera kw1407]
MHSATLMSVAAFLAGVSAHGVILAAQGDAGSPASVGFQVNNALPRNCTTISPCQQDTTLIRDAEIAAGTVTECGRTELTGNIDVKTSTEDAISSGAVTSVAAGSQLTITIHQVNADGAGPYSCDLDEASDSGVMSHNLTVANNIPGTNGLSLAKEQDFNITVTMPSTLNCSGGSTGNVCTVRCRNNAAAGPFGGCFAVQQTDATAAAATTTSSSAKASKTKGSSATSTGTKKGKNNNARDLLSNSMRWAKRALLENDS